MRTTFFNNWPPKVFLDIFWRIPNLLNDLKYFHYTNTFNNEMKLKRTFLQSIWTMTSFFCFCRIDEILSKRIFQNDRKSNLSKFSNQLKHFGNTSKQFRQSLNHQYRSLFAKINSTNLNEHDWTICWQADSWYQKSSTCTEVSLHLNCFSAHILLEMCLDFPKMLCTASISQMTREKKTNAKIRRKKNRKEKS